MEFKQNTIPKPLLFYKFLVFRMSLQYYTFLRVNARFLLLHPIQNIAAINSRILFKKRNNTTIIRFFIPLFQKYVYDIRAFPELTFDNIVSINKRAHIPLISQRKYPDYIVRIQILFKESQFLDPPLYILIRSGMSIYITLF